jgi:hypothetical protein
MLSGLHHMKEVKPMVHDICTNCGEAFEKGQEYVYDVQAGTKFCDAACWQDHLRETWLDEALDELYQYKRTDRSVITGYVGMEGG